MARRRCLWLAGVASAVWIGLAEQPVETRAGQGKEKGGNAIVFTLKKEFIEKHRNRVTIDSDMVVDKMSPIHPDKDDGEIHIAGRADQIGLPFVAEIMHAKEQKQAVKAIRNAEGKTAPIKVRGAWRIWCEHAEGVNQKQGARLERFDTSNPSHVFEIHPVTRVGDLDISDSVEAPVNFKFKKPETAFTHYENVSCTIKDNTDTVTIRTNMAGYNIPEFILESADDEVGGKVFDEQDGRFMFVSVRDLDGELLIRHVRAAFIKGTEVEVAARTLAKGQRLHVAGIPRISLNLVHWRVENKGDERDPLNWNLPYEIIVVGVVSE
jgi:hypothetical protein